MVPLFERVLSDVAAGPPVRYPVDCARMDALTNATAEDPDPDVDGIALGLAAEAGRTPAARAAQAAMDAAEAASRARRDRRLRERLPGLMDAHAAALAARMDAAAAAAASPSPATPISQERRAEWTADVVGAPFKGCLPRTITISSAANGGLCGVGFAVGDELLLALGPADRDGTFHVALCDTFMAWHSLTADDRRVLMGANDQVCPSRRVW
ncbi:hypothetical protein I4F81_006680 [Pyropia yezoensis]|uniref:Uncharacterized protein n=1 Tax=Pyropia yezoensis TaxID=2788 RepID=A0ACC3C1X3_PYRYE|nr:hypothetical protein I4F81_006680 [Neopyropia yezoensis]